MSGHIWSLSLALATMVTASSASSAQTLGPQTLSDVAYAHPSGISLCMDASLPDTEQAVPAVVIVHGGAWVAGDRRSNVEPLFQPLSDAGFAWFSISYRLATNVMQFGAAVDDIQSAVRFIRAHAAEYHIDPDRIALVGESAGGHLAAMAALRADADSAVRAVVALYTPSDLVKLAKTSSFIPPVLRDSVSGTLFENLLMTGLAQLSPLNNVRRNMPPFLFIHGTADPLVPFEQSTGMCDRMKAAGASCEVYPVKGVGHGIRWWESQPAIAAGYKRKMVEWLNGQFGISVL
ncbi:MAG: Alpha/beta hydrolase fold-3 domain protein [Bryobacterales bacterium]|nr:Alpha/beta hydrolase fold-3 domain protein [Bryobacterales bacterium]